MPRSRRPNKSRSGSRHSRPNTRNRTLAIIGIAILLVAVIVYRIVTIQQQASPTATALASGGATPHLVGTKTYSSAPPMLIDTTKQYIATVTMAKGGAVRDPAIPG